jgi:hypothetical protein
MKKVIIYIFLSLFLLFGILGFLRMVVGGGEDTWICVEGEWVKHGAPSASKPETPCGR